MNLEQKMGFIPRSEIKCDVEELIDNLLNKGWLAHGSIVNIKGPVLKGDKVFASSVARVAILKAIYLNNVELNYPFSTSEPFELVINGEPREDTINDSGYVYLIKDKSSFVNEPVGSWQWISEKKQIPYQVKIEVNKSDFKYPVYTKLEEEF